MLQRQPSADGSVNVKVLIVDDEDLTRVLLRQMLERVKVDRMEIFQADDGEAAVKIAEAERPDLVLLDLLLPKMNGHEVCRRLRDIPDYDPYIIILTARGYMEDRQQARELGANQFMTKPFNPSRLIAELNTLWGGPHLP